MTRLFVACFCALSLSAGEVVPAFKTRGYYTTFMRMPTFGLTEWKTMVDRVEQDGGNHNLDADWFTSSPMLQPERARERAVREKWPDSRLKDYQSRADRLALIAQRCQSSTNQTVQELRRVAAKVAVKWTAK